ncbi:hypothetical protein BAOM_3068 [Peribacillus asahii]|uniref:Uncharacterized protein n=1 Tax=Peribacillus asahii TaxID=228899 RepID=A0A3Q9RKA4_9BACI|nr:hypothetical protein [Peribacillus asahii]AZV43677.1 hypothetical protein BAOM_3068 [Peribacillus asahii]
MENLINIIKKHELEPTELARIIYVYLDVFGDENYEELKEEIYFIYLSE